MQTKLILSFLTLLFLTFLVPSDVFGDWYDTSWDHRNKITVSLNTVTSSDLSDFPVLISLTDSDFTQANSDGSANSFKVPLPLTLKITGNEPLVFESKVNQKVLSFYDEQKFIEIVSVWNGSSQDVSQLASLLGISDQELPPWVANLALWVSENKITAGDMIVSIEHLINN